MLIDENIQVLIYSPILTTGVDIQVPFEKVYFNADGHRSCNCRPGLQGICRCRIVKSNEVVCFFGNSSSEGVNESQVHEKIKKEEDFTKRYFTQIKNYHLADDFSIENGRLYPITECTHMLDQSILNTIEDNANFKKSFVELSKTYHYEISGWFYPNFEEDEKNIQHDWKIFSEAFKNNKKEIEQSTILKMNTDSKYGQKCLEITRSGQKSDIIDVRIAAKLRPVEARLGGLDKVQKTKVEKIKNMILPIDRLKILMDAKEKGLDPILEFKKYSHVRDVDKILDDKFYLGRQTAFGTAVELLNDALLEIGFASPVDFKTSIPSNVIETKFVAKAILDDCAKFGRGAAPYKSKKGRPNVNPIVRALKKELLEVLGLTLKQPKHNSQGFQICFNDKEGFDQQEILDVWQPNMDLNIAKKNAESRKTKAITQNLLEQSRKKRKME